MNVLHDGPATSAALARALGAFWAADAARKRGFPNAWRSGTSGIRVSWPRDGAVYHDPTSRRLLTRCESPQFVFEQVRPSTGLGPAGGECEGCGAEFIETRFGVGAVFPLARARVRSSAALVASGRAVG
jgi:hypothetical protein